jgi:hypothetical protein
MRPSEGHAERQAHTEPHMVRAVLVALGLATLIGISLVVVL